MKSKFPAVLIAAVAVLLFFGGRTLIDLTNDVANTLPHGNGGTDVTSPGAAGHGLRSNGANWASAAFACGDLSDSVASCNTDATNASNISSGTLGAARLPNPSASTLGGIESFALVTHQFLTDISTGGVAHAAQPACAYLSDAAASCNTDATNASNIGSGTLAAARMATEPRKRAISFTIGDPNASSALGTTSTYTDYVTVPFACTISAYNLLIDGGTITVKFWKVATGTAIPTSSNSISTSGVGISSGTAIHSTTVTDFTTTAVSDNDITAMNVTAAATAKYVNGVLECDQ